MLMARVTAAVTTTTSIWTGRFGETPSWSANAKPASAPRQRSIASKAMNVGQLKTPVNTRFPRMPNMLRVMTLLGVPDTGPLTASRPIAPQKRLPTTTTSNPCQTSSPNTMSSPPRTM